MLAIVVLVAGCSMGGGPTTTSATVATGSTTTVGVATSGSSTTTASTAVSTTATPGTTGTTGIVITLPSTTSTSALTTTTTAVALASAETLLPNGHIRAMGFIDAVYKHAGVGYLSIDYAQMLTGPAATAAAIAEGFISPGETLDTDYYISNVNPAKRVFELSLSVAITTSTRWVPGDDMNAPCSLPTWASFWGPTGTLTPSELHLHAVPWWIERDGMVVVKIDEQYLP